MSNDFDMTPRSTAIRLAIGSDLHNEFERPNPENQAQRLADYGQDHPESGPVIADLRGRVDAVLLAGDILAGDPEAMIGYCDQVARYLDVPVICIAGNHDYWGSRIFRGSRAEFVEAFREHAAKTDGRVRFLENDSSTVTVNGIATHILGCTLWTDYQLLGDLRRGLAVARECISDRGHIGGDAGGCFEPEAARDIHLTSRAWLGSEVARTRLEHGPESRIIVMTHHSPHPSSRREEGWEAIAPAYANDMTAEILEWQPLLWLHGHTHERVEREADQTKVIANCRGYVDYEYGAEDFELRVVEA